MPISMRFDRSADGSLIVLGDTREEDNDDSGEVFRFTGPPHRAGDENDVSNNDSVIVFSPPGQRDDENAAELVENLDDENAAELVDEPENLDDSVRMTNDKCPITKLPFEKPVKNGCGHVYEKEAIHAMNKHWTRRGCVVLRCPVPGCQRVTRVRDLKSL